jgi:predicted transcriptional regulator
MSNTNVRSNNIPSSIAASKQNWVHTILLALRYSSTALKVGQLAKLVGKDEKSITLTLSTLNNCKVVVEKCGGYKIAKGVSDQDILIHSNLIQQ